MSDQIDRILQWSVGHAVAMLLALFTVILTKQTKVFLLIFICSLAIYLYRERTYVLTRWWGIGRANWITLIRLSLIVNALLLYPLLYPHWLLVVLILSIVLDGVDGRIAVQYEEQSDFGHYLDVEVDAFAIAVLSILLWHYEAFGAWILLSGALRYCYVLFTNRVVETQKLEPKRQYASVIAVTTYIVMSLRLGFDAPVLTLAVYVALILLICSFFRSAWYQWQD